MKTIITISAALDLLAATSPLAIAMGLLLILYVVRGTKGFN